MGLTKVFCKKISSGNDTITGPFLPDNAVLKDLPIISGILSILVISKISFAIGAAVDEPEPPCSTTTEAAYVKDFFAPDAWSEIKIPLEAMRPQFRGMRLNMNKFSGDSIVQFGILVGNKVEEDFMLMIDSIYLK